MPIFKKRTLLLIGGGVLAHLSFAVTDAKAHFLIVGGGDLPEEAVHQFVDWAGGSRAHILIVPWASSDCDDSFETYKSFFEGNDAKPEVEQAVNPDVLANDEGRRQFLTQLSRSTGLFFGGGDQVRLMDALRQSRALQKLRELVVNGFPMGGSSAGAAIFSQRMLTGRASQTADGVGVLQANIIVDQHFLERQRKARLKSALRSWMRDFMNQKKTRPPSVFGIGIDRNTALLVDGGDLRAVGRSKVVFIELQDDQKEGVFREKEYANEKISMTHSIALKPTQPSIATH